MNRIKSITLVNWKGQNCTHDLDALNLIVGPTGAGKTALVSAISFAITGKTEVGSRVDQIAQYLCGPSGASVTLTLTNGFAFTREIKRQARHNKASMSLTIHSQRVMSLKKAQEQINSEISDFAPMYDLSEFLSLSPERRRVFVTDLCAHTSATKTTRDEIARRIEIEAWKLLCGKGVCDVVARKIKIESTDAAYTRAFVNELREALGGDVGGTTTIMIDQVAELSKEIKADDTAESIGVVVDRATQVVNQTRSDHDAAVLAARSLAEKRAEIADVVESAADLTSLEKKLSDERDSVRDQIGKAVGQADARQAFTNKFIELESSRVREQESMTKLKEFDEQDLLNSITERKNQATEIGQQMLAHNERRQGRRDLIDKRSELGHKGVALIEREALLKRQITERERSRSSAAMRQKARNLRDFIHSVVTPVVSEAMAQDAQSLFDFVHDFVSDYDDDGTLERLMAESLETSDALAGLNNQIESVQKMIDETAEIDQSEYDRLTRERGKLLESLAEDEVRVRDHKRECAAVHDRLGTIKSNITSTRDNYNELMKQTISASVETMREHETRVSSQLDTVRQKIKEKQRFQVLDRGYVDLTAQSEKLTKIHETAKIVRDAVRNVREPLIEAIIEPLMSRLRDFLSATSLPVDPYVRFMSSSDRAIFDIGWLANETRVSIATMSGGEQQLFGTALAYALTQLSDAQMQFVLIEAAEMDSAHLRITCEALKKLKHTFANAIVATNAEPHGIDDNEWRLILKRFEPVSTTTESDDERSRTEEGVTQP